MTVDSFVFWLFVAAWLVVLGLIVFIQLPRALGEARRLVGRIVAIADQSPLPLQMAKAHGDVSRIGLAIGRLPSLQGRTAAALASIRTTPLVPPTIVDIVKRIRTEIRAFRQAAR